MIAGQQKYRMLALDVDGTIALKDYSVPEQIKEAVNDAMTAGAVVSLVTGRIRSSALRYANELGTNGPTVSHQGAVVTAVGGEKDLHSERLEAALALDALTGMRAASLQVTVFADDEIWVEEETEWASQYAVRMKKPLRTERSLDEVVLTGPTVVMATGEPAQIAALAGGLRSQLGSEAAVTQSLPHFCEVASTHATKAHGLARASSECGITAAEVIAVGDGEGDVSMIKWAGLGVASGEAHPAAVAAADVRIAGPEAAGVADLVHNLLNQGKLGR